MKTLRAIFARFTGLFRRGAIETEMNEELRAHLEALVERNLAAGMAPDEARAAARRAFGGVAQIQERARDERRSAWGEHLARDLRYAAQALRKAPAFTLTAVLTLAFGIGVNAALFTLYNAIALRPLPVREADEIVLVRRPGGSSQRFSYPLIREFREGTTSFAELAAWHDSPMPLLEVEGARIDAGFVLRGRGLGIARDWVNVQVVSGNYFAALGAELALGRSFLPEEDRAPGGPAVIVLQHRFWQTYFRGDPQVLGRLVVLAGKPYQVIGVAAAGFVGHQPAPPVGWVPLMAVWSAETLANRDIAGIALIGRLKPGVSLEQARAELKVIANREGRTEQERRWTPALDRGMKFFDFPVSVETLPVIGPAILGFAMVLLIACTNVANLLLARGVTRQQEIAVRLTLGASRGRIIRQLLTENLLLCALAAVVGLVVAQAMLSGVLAQLPDAWGGAGEIRQWRFLATGVDGRVIAFVAGLALVTTLLAGLLPALQASRADLISASKNAGSIFGRRMSQSRLRNLLVVGQVAVCVLLLSCAGLLGRNMLELRKLDLGFDARQVFETFTTPRNGVPTDPVTRLAVLRQTLEAVQALPGVASASRFAGNSFIGKGGTTPVTAPAGGGAAGSLTLNVRSQMISAEFFTTLGIPLVRGRTFTTQEIEAGADVVVISEATAQRCWPGQDAIGRTLVVTEAAFAWPPANRSAADRRPAGGVRECRVVGVARDLRTAMRKREEPAMYLPLRPAAMMAAQILIRPRSDTLAALNEIVRAAGEAGVDVRFNDRMATRAEEMLAPFVLLGWLSGALGALALTMAAVGLYGVMAFAVNQRVREIGIRVALGATAPNVIRLFVRQGMTLVVVGALVGLVGGGLFALVLRKITFGLDGAFDAIAFGAVTALLGVVALIACWLPARRATRVDPMVALRAE